MKGTYRKKLIRKLGTVARARKKLPRRAKAKVDKGVKVGKGAKVVKKAKASRPGVAAAIQEPAPANPLQTLLRAAGFAARKHHGQTRADGQTPYFSHVARVTLILTHVFGVQDETILTAALLHDTLEDTATDYDEIQEQFGERVADYVVTLTKNVTLPKKQREEDYAKRLAEAPEAVMIAKMADLYDNLSDRIHSPKLRKTSATAEKLLGIFGRRLRSRIGLSAHGKLSELLEEVKTLQLAEIVPIAPGALETK